MKHSLSIRLTAITGTILLLCSIALTLSASYNAEKQFAAVMSTEAVLSIEAEGEPTPQDSVGAAVVVQAQREFHAAGLISLAVISMFGTAAVYLFTKRTFRPLQELNEQMAAITENSLDVRIGDDQRADEVGALCRSFNIMLDRLSKSFSAQKRFSANVTHELKTPLTTMQASVQVLRLDAAPT